MNKILKRSELNRQIEEKTVLHKVLFGFQCPKCFIFSGSVSHNPNDAPGCCGYIEMIAYQIRKKE